jgi:tight adherence protein C
MGNPLLLVISVFLATMAVLSWVGYRIYQRPGRALRQLGTPVITTTVDVVADGMEPRTNTVVTFLQAIGTKVQPSGEAEAAGLRTQLIQAGFRHEHAAPVFYGVRIVALITVVILTFAMTARMSNPNPGLSIALIGMGGMVGWILPKMFLERRIKGRRETMRLSLPDALDMMVVSVEAGLGLDMAMQHVARELQIAHPLLSEELTLVTLEMRAGKRRADALRNFSDRSGEPELRKLVAILVQSDRFGTSMAESLRTHSDFMRVKRRQEAEERAGKVGVKLVFPIFFFILPSILVVAAGPGLLQVFKYLFPMMRSIH